MSAERREDFTPEERALIRLRLGMDIKPPEPDYADDIEAMLIAMNESPYLPDAAAALDALLARGWKPPSAHEETVYRVTWGRPDEPLRYEYFVTAKSAQSCANFRSGTVEQASVVWSQLTPETES